MSINLKPYQNKAVDDLVKTVGSLLNTNGPGEVCVFQSPTGSGKTVMTAKFIETLIKDLPEDDLCFVWMSIGKGELHLQSKRKLDEIFRGSPRVSLIEEEFRGGRERIVRNEVVVANWEKIRNKDKNKDDWSNVIMREGEVTNFREVLKKTREQRKLILIIDESHISAATERANELREIISADVVIEMSATPRLMPTLLDVTQGKAGYIRVEPKDVIEEGMIKKEVIINENINSISEDTDSQAAVLQAAYSKRIELEEAYKNNGSDIKPLVLIQVPSAEAGEVKIEAVKEFLSKKKISAKNKKLAVWLSELKTENVLDINSPESDVEFLIFKQAIDTGWDCPRAQILVKFREVKNEVFEIQTVGRILRMPEQKHYTDENLNRAYIFTNLESFDVKKEDYNPNIINHLKSSRIKKYEPIKLSSYYKSRVDYGDVTSSFSPVFAKTANSYFGIKSTTSQKNVQNLIKARGLDFDLKKHSRRIISNTNINADTFDEIEGNIKAKEYAKLQLAVNDLQALFEQFIKSNLGSFTSVKRSVPTVKTAIYAWFRNCLASDNWQDEMILIQQLVVYNKNQIHFEKILSNAVAEYKHVRDNEIKKRVEETEQWFGFELPKELFHNKHQDEEVDTKNYAYSPCYLSVNRSEPEKRFENFVKTNSANVVWWWKNGENKKDFFGVKYEYSGNIHTFYPDYIVKFKDGKIGFFETKDVADRDGQTYTRAKAETFQLWLKEQKRKDLFGGIVIERNKTWLINQSKKYNWSKCEGGDWSDWTELVF